jgi:hypothetical protein
MAEPRALAVSVPQYYSSRETLLPLQIPHIIPSLDLPTILPTMFQFVNSLIDKLTQSQFSSVPDYPAAIQHNKKSL